MHKEKITIEDLNKGCQNFIENEGRASYYDVALEIVEDHPFQATLIILTTWNGGRWRFNSNQPQSLIDLRTTITECQLLFDQFLIKNRTNITKQEHRMSRQCHCYLNVGNKQHST
jgi:hypothetical protein